MRVGVYIITVQNELIISLINNPTPINFNLTVALNIWLLNLLQRGKTPTKKECPRNDIKLYLIVRLLFWKSGLCLSLQLLPSTLVAPVKIQSIGQRSIHKLFLFNRTV